jgi:hypothetical protein
MRQDRNHLRLALGVGSFIILAVIVMLSQQVQRLPQQNPSASVPTDGFAIYESCGTSRACFGRIDTIAAAGFKEVIDYALWAGNPSMQDLLSYADHATRVGIKIIWNFKDYWQISTPYAQTYPAMAASCGCSTNTDFLTYVVTILGSHPSTWGYYIADEPSAASHQAVQVVSDLIHHADPAHPRLFVGLAWSVPAVNSLLSLYADSAEVLATDYYPIGKGLNINNTGALAGAVQQVAASHDRSAAIVLQAHSWNHYPPGSYAPPCIAAPYPTRDDMRAQLHQTLSNSTPRLILWYSYFDLLKPLCPEDDYATHWSNLVSVMQS